jgi:hypothetical protein
MKRLWSHPLGREILVILVIKIALIFAIWWAFFSDPAGHSLSPEQVSHALLSAKTVSDNPKE